MGMTLIYCKECPKLIMIGNSIGRIGKPIAHDVLEGDEGTTGDEEPLRDSWGAPVAVSTGKKVVAIHRGHFHLLLPDEPWEPQLHASIDDYIVALQKKYPKESQTALVP